jgi:serine/threonine protein kinase
MLFQMLAGVLPFRGDSMAELMYKIANEEAPDIRIIRKELSARLAEVVALSLAKQPELRYQDGDRFAADLREVIAVWEAPHRHPHMPPPAVRLRLNLMPRWFNLLRPAGAEPRAYDATQVMNADGSADV